MPDVSYVHLYKGNTPDNLRKAKEAGFDGVELLTPDPVLFDWDELERSLKEQSLELACINSGRLAMEYGLTLLNPDAAVRQKASDTFKEVIRVCHRFGCYANIGIFRGPAISGKPVAYTRDLFVEILKDLCDYAAGFNVGINFEPTNRFEINFINTTEQGVDIVNRVSRPNLGLLLDLFHMNLEDADLITEIVRCRDLVKHFHFTDTDRWPAGNSHGSINFPFLINLLKLLGYNGFLSQNLVDANDADQCAKRTADYLRELIQA